MTGFIIFVIVVVVIIVVVRQQKKRKEAEAIEELKNSSSYVAAVEIKDVLSKKGYEVSDIFTNIIEGHIAYGHVTFSSKEKRTGENGDLYFSNNSRGLQYSLEANLQIKNTAHINLSDHYYAIENANTGILVESKELSQTIPHFLEIVAEVIKNNRYEFKHPDWYHEDPNAKVYLNVGLLEG